MLESAIQRKIIVHLEKKGYLVVKYIQTTKNGWPDLGAHKDGKCIYIEVKRPGEDLDPLQAYRHEELKKKGFKVIVATSVIDVIVLIG